MSKSTTRSRAGAPGNGGEKSVTHRDMAEPPRLRHSDPPPAIYALKPWTVRETNGKWMITRTPFFDAKPEWKGPYQSLDNAAKAIARAITQEVAERHNRRIDFYGDKA